MLISTLLSLWDIYNTPHMHHQQKMLRIDINTTTSFKPSGDIHPNLWNFCLYKTADKTNFCGLMRFESLAKPNGLKVVDLFCHLLACTGACANNPVELVTSRASAEMSAPRFRPCPQCGVRVPRVVGHRYRSPVIELVFLWNGVPISWDNKTTTTFFFLISC